MTRRYHFISGLPRSGSTLLSAILRQNPRLHAAMSSPVASLFHSMLNTFSVQSENAPHVSQAQRRSLLRGLFDNYYIAQDDKGVIFDTSRAWSTRMGALLDLFPESKVICCVRNVAWIMDSLERQYQKNPYENTKFFNDDTERNTVYSRVDTLGQRNRMVGFAWSALKEAFYGEHAAALLIVDYDLLCQAPERTLPLIYNFIAEPSFEHNYDHVQYDANEFDRQLGVEGLHRIDGPVVFRPRRTLLPPDLFEKYADMSFWQDVENSRASVITASTSTDRPAQPQSTKVLV